MQIPGFQVIKSCYQCGRCTGFCPLSAFGEFSPRIIAKELLRDSIPSKKIWECLTCDLCSANCPMNIQFSEFILQCRQAFKSSEDFSLNEAHSGYFSMLSEFMRSESIEPNRSLDIPGNLKHKKRGKILFFRGCLPFFNFDTHLSELDMDYSLATRSVIRILNHLGIVPALTTKERCCGHDALWHGDLETFKQLARLNLKAIEETGAELVIFNCAECYRTFKIDYPRYFGRLSFEVISFPEFLEQHLDNTGKILKSYQKVKITYHDPCRLGRQLGVYEAPRNVLKGIPGVDLIEMENIKEQANCCGVSSWLNCTQKARIIREQRLQEAQRTEADYLITTCPKCQVHFKCLKKEFKEEEPEKFRIHVQDFAVFIAKLLNLL
ncbi:MAG: (Fe-S)-binding protein [Candidatus Helarchaeales archaeon]